MFNRNVSVDFCIHWSIIIYNFGCIFFRVCTDVNGCIERTTSLYSLFYHSSSDMLHVIFIIGQFDPVLICLQRKG